jgi:hypothetical protein
VEDLSDENRIDAGTIVEQVRTVVAEGRDRFPRSWTPQATAEDVRAGDDLQPIHLVESLHHLHHNWDMTEAIQFKGRGRGPKAVLHRLLSRIVTIALSDYLGQENAYRAAIAQAVDAIAYRVDEVAFRDERAILQAVREDLLDLARHVENRLERSDRTD